MINPEDFEPDLDTLTRGELAERGGVVATVAEVLDEWSAEQPTASSLRIGSFLELLADHGYRVTPIDVPDGPMLPPPTE